MAHLNLCELERSEFVGREGGNGGRNDFGDLLHEGFRLEGVPRSARGVEEATGADEAESEQDRSEIRFLCGRRRCCVSALIGRGISLSTSLRPRATHCARSEKRLGSSEHFRLSETELEKNYVISSQIRSAPRSTSVPNSFLLRSEDD